MKHLVRLLVLGTAFPTAVAGAVPDPAPGCRTVMLVSTAPQKPKVTWLAGGRDATCAVRQGDVYCWGQPFGTKDLERSVVAPRRIEGLSGVDAVSVSSASACARRGGRIACWGDNRWGQLGDGSTAERTKPVSVRALKGQIEAVVAGQHHTCAIVDGGARCWGHGAYGQLGDGTNRSPAMVPAQVHGLKAGVTSLALGVFTTCAVVSGRVKCWGMNTSGELALDPRTNSLVPVDAPVTGDGFVGVRSNGFTTCAFGASRITCWGDHTWQSPDGLDSISDLAPGLEGGWFIRSGKVTCFRWTSPALAVVPLPARATQISAGAHHTCALAGGEVYCWGNRGHGALGDGTPARLLYDPTFIRTKPKPVAWPQPAAAP